jgi:hypothetical protein
MAVWPTLMIFRILLIIDPTLLEEHLLLVITVESEGSDVDDSCQ